METKQRFDSLSGDGLSPLIKVAPALMHAENLSMQSLARAGRGGVGVTDLREALEGRSSLSMSNPNLAAAASAASARVPSISTLDHAPSHSGDAAQRLTRARSRPEKSKLQLRGDPLEVRDMLNRLHVGKGGAANGSALLKSSFPVTQKPDIK